MGSLWRLQKLSRRRGKLLARYLRWSIKWRDGLESGQYYDLLRRGFLDNRPDDAEPEVGGLEFYLDAFRELSTCRPAGLDLGAIPFTAVVEYSKVYELEDFDDFFYIIRSMDNTFLKTMDEKSQNKAAEKPKGKDATGKPDKAN